MKRIVSLIFLMAPARAEANIATEKYCRALSAKAKVSQDYWPYFFSNFTVDAKQDASQQRSDDALRVGLVLNVEEIVRGLDQGAFAEAECKRYSAEIAYLDALGDIFSNAERRGRRAELAFIEQVLAKKDEDLKITEQRLAAKHDTLYQLLEIKQSINQTQLRKLDVENALKNLNSAPEIADPEPSQSLPGLQADYLAASMRSVAAQEVQLAGSPWKLALLTGYRVFSGPRSDDLKEKGTAFVQIEGRYALGTISRNRKISEWQQSENEWASADPSSALTKGAELYQRIVSEHENSNQKLALIRAHLEDLDRIRKPLQAANEANAQAMYQKISSEFTALAMEEAYVSAKTDALKPFLQHEPKLPPKLPDAVAAPSTLAFKVTKGEIERAENDAYRVVSTQLRLKRETIRGDDITVKFVYLGPSEHIEKLGSGAIRQQFGVYLLARNQCNLLYVMVRLDQKNQAKLAVQKKINPGLSTHEECANDGYDTIEPEFSTEIGTIMPSKALRLRAKVVAMKLLVEIDGKLIWRGNIASAAALTVPGYGGVRTDNAKVEFRLEP